MTFELKMTAPASCKQLSGAGLLIIVVFSGGYLTQDGLCKQVLDRVPRERKSLPNGLPTWKDKRQRMAHGPRDTGPPE